MLRGKRRLRNPARRVDDVRPERAVDRPIDRSRAQFSASGLGDLIGFLVRVVLPTWAKGILLRLLAERDVRRVLAEAPEPFTPASTEKQAALSHFEPRNSLITRGPQRGPRRQFHNEVLQSSQPIHDCFKTFLAVVRGEARRLLDDKKPGDDLCWPEFSEAWFAAVRRIVLGDGARDDEVLTDELTRLRANVNWVFFRPVNKTLRENYRARLTEYLDAAEPDSFAARIAAHSAISGKLAADQVTQWLFAFDAGAITTFRALALLLAHPVSFANAEPDSATWRRGGFDLPHLRAAFLEAVRLYPTVPALLRQTTAPTNWEGRVVDEGAGLIIYVPFFHRDTDRLPYADRFTPGIWIGRDPADALPLLPFSFGPSACPGRHLVSLIGSAWLAVLLTEATPVLVSPHRSMRPDRFPGPSIISKYALSSLALHGKSCRNEPETCCGKRRAPQHAGIINAATRSY